MKATVKTTEFLKGQAVRKEGETDFEQEVICRETQVINLYPEIKYQTFEGFGGAMTDAVAAALEPFDAAARKDILAEYYGREGLGYRFVRTPIDSCDFSRGQYCAYDPTKENGLDEAKLDKNVAGILEQLAVIKTLTGNELKVMLTPWSPPAQMKENGVREAGTALKPAYYRAWADYVCAYIKAYRKRGVPVTMLSLQNEPNAAQTWDSCQFSARTEKAYLEEALYPALVRHGLTDIGVYIWDHNKERIYERARDILDANTEKMVEGVAFHWYSGDHFEAVGLVRERYPDKKLVFSEGCIEYSRFDMDSQLQNAWMYAHDIIGNFNAGMHAFLDWNLVLDKDGGPNYVGNLCDAPIMCDGEKKTVEKRVSFYYLEHFARFIKPGAKRIAHSKFDSRMDVLTAENPDGEIVLVVCNQKKEAQPVFIRMEGEIARWELPAESISTFTIR